MRMGWSETSLSPGEPPRWTGRERRGEEVREGWRNRRRGGGGGGGGDWEAAGRYGSEEAIFSKRAIQKKRMKQKNNT